MDSDKSASTGSEHANSLAPDKRGKYRIMAEIKRLEQDSKFLECETKLKAAHTENVEVQNQQLKKTKASKESLCEELEELERLEDAASICKELLLYVEMKPDALLPVTNGPANPSWNRWFEGFQDSEGCRCQIM